MSKGALQDLDRSQPQIRFSVLILLALVAIGFRLVPYALNALSIPFDLSSTYYPWNFSPILPLCLFGAAFYRAGYVAYITPLLLYLVSDLGIWLITGKVEWAFYASQPVTYLAVVLTVSCGFYLRKQRSWHRLVLTGFGAAAVFFIVSNFGVWIFGGGYAYPMTLAGLLDCYVQAIPFFRNSLLSMAIFLPMLFSQASLRTVFDQEAQFDRTN